MVKILPGLPCDRLWRCASRNRVVPSSKASCERLSQCYLKTLPAIG
ncbi:MAG: hypothetical protein KME32_32570 [Mojavia pulchra JT2-VF2]|uniref:Uncharacterized protein n=1 Tax=Mojavia pulchra JT2-VF2 TaxID=287848 RepID=A0A951Q5I1_9NOST|nr:hypothetical protein [Mojavia pulchra JT2-VF2]